METELLQFIGNYGVMAMILYFTLKEGFAYLNKKNGNGKDKEIDDLKREVYGLKEEAHELKEKLAKIETNDLFHIKIQLEDNAKEHREIRDILLEIKSLIN